MLCELRIEYADGSTQTVLSDDSWKTATGPYVSNNIYSGDFYDARLEIKGWENADFDDSEWSRAVAVEAPSPILKAQNMPAIESEGVIDAVDMKKLADTLYVYNFGKNFSGLCELTVRGEKGTKLTMKHAEIQKQDGNIEPGNINIYFYPKKDMEFQTDVYVLSGEGEETFKPKFSYHGFQYVEVKSDKPIELKQSDLKAKFIHTAVRPVGKFRCSNDMLNKLGEATKTSYLSNLMSIPTDCPQREKNGWTADAHVSVDLGLMNFDGIRVYEKWMDDFVDNQTAEGRISGIIPSAGWGYADWIGPVWDAAMFIIPNAVYNYYGDTKCVEKIWPVAVNYLEYLKAREDENGTVTYGIGDWVFYKTPTPTDYTTTCYYYLDNLLMAKFANLLNKDGERYAKKANELKTLINTKYFDKDKVLYSTGTQAAQAVALYLGLVPAEYEQKVADNLSEMIKANDGLLDFGMLGSKTVLRMLTKYGHAQQAYELATQTEAPSWGAWMEKGLTSLPETWVLSPTFKDASLNHVFLGDVYAWMYNDLAGINYDPEKPGFSNILIRPHFVDGLDWVDAEYDSVKGLIKSSWKKEGENVTLTVTIPANCTARVEVGDDIRKISSGTHNLKYKTIH
jgi:alpha-L-rhamnosidase